MLILKALFREFTEGKRRTDMLYANIATWFKREIDNFSIQKLL
jgi:hypothetical protein